MGLSRDGQPQPAQGRNGWGTTGLEVTLGCGGHFVVFLLYTCLVLASDPPLQPPAHHPASSGPKGQRTKSEQWFCPCRHHLQVHVSFHQVIREGEEGVRIGH